MTGVGSQPSFFDSTAFVDAQPVLHATRADLDLELVAQHIAHARDQVPRFDAPADPVAFLRSRRCLVDDTPTLAGLLVFGRQPHVFVPYVGLALTHFYDTAVSTQVRHSDTLEGPLSDIILRAEEYLWEHTQHGFDTSAGPQRRRVDQYPRSVLRELTVNAVCHRDYSRTSRIRLQVFADRIEWVSPGSLPSPVTVDNILFEQATRNPTIVRLLYEAGFIEERGLGLDTVFRALEHYGHPTPMLLDTGGSFMVTVHGRQNIVVQGDTRDLNEVQLKLLALLSNQGSFTIAEGERLFPSRSRRMLNRDIRGLLERQIITRTGNTNNVRYLPAQPVGDL